MKRQKRVLIVEDSPTTALALACLVESLGFQASVVADGDRAVIESRLNDYELILMDLRLPHRDGFDVAKAIRAEGNHVPIISITAYPLPSDEKQCEEAGFNDSLCKGYRRDELERIISLWANSGITNQLEHGKTRNRKGGTTDYVVTGANIHRL